jgi:regulator of protease activity HflC (stomatin/prohibitin superfamily)
VISNVNRVFADELMDLPKQMCITRDNASISLDVLLSYKVINPKGTYSISGCGQASVTTHFSPLVLALLTFKCCLLICIICYTVLQ